MHTALRSKTGCLGYLASSFTEDFLFIPAENKISCDGTRKFPCTNYTQTHSLTLSWTCTGRSYHNRMGSSAGVVATPLILCAQMAQSGGLPFEASLGNLVPLSQNEIELS